MKVIMKTAAVAALASGFIVALTIVALELYGAAWPGTTRVSSAPGVVLEIDFSHVDWGAIMPGYTDIVAGDQNMSTPQSPTVSNTGDAPGSLCLQFSEMTGPLKGKITSFDARFLGETIDPIAAGTQVCFANPLGPGEVAKLDLSIHPPIVLTPDVYIGSLDVGGIAVPTHAVVGTSGNPPNIECKWELPDMDSGAPGIQYTTSPGHVHDDDMAVIPDADNNPSNGFQVPCSGPPASVPSMPDGVQHMIQVNPNLENLPEEQRIQLWTAADSPLGIDSIIDV
jgi:hypothetical protein